MATHGKPETALPIYSEGALTGACWSCGDMRAAHFCQSCGKLQPARPTDYFTFFGLPRKLRLDVAELEREFHRLSRRLHPDVYATITGKEQQWSLEKSSQLNDAYRTLRDPIERTAYLLKLEGVQLEEQSKAATDRARASGRDKQQVVPPDLLEEVFELNLQLEEFKANRKLDQDDARVDPRLQPEAGLQPELLRQIESAREHMEQKLAASDAELETLWSQWDAHQDRVAQPPSAVRKDSVAQPPSAVRKDSVAQPPSAVHSEAEREQLLAGMTALLNRRTYLRNLVRDITAALEGV